MASDRIEGNWKQLKGRIKQEWGQLTDDDLDEAEGHRDYLIGKVQERYGIAKEQAREQVEAFERKL
ncbi:CsbD family protein [Guyparkeria hydrothermalis]|uniref:CsbD family protein n=1 Tax=Guyparkeria hydrothermalis TaxID=923 RepID=UPI0020227739|nr:CsbD family protein [Guyparkeria hydrothermalis]MCL7744150.1 CsbD family protein [Guyparkeria hydrothermalis]